MKKHELLEEAFGLIDDAFITQARQPARVLSMKKRWRRIALAAACLILAVAMIPASVLIGGLLTNSGNTPPAQDENGDENTPGGVVDRVDTDCNGYQNDRLPNGEALKALGFEGSTVKILSWEEEEAQTFPKENSETDPLKGKLWVHYRGIEERFAITFSPSWYSSHTSDQEDFLTAARADDAAYDLIQTRSIFPATLAIEGRLCNLRTLGYPDLEMPWWPDSVDQWTQNGSLFFIASNSSAMGISNMSVVFVNDGMITAKGGASPVQSVLRGVWTVEEMTNISKLFAGAAETADGENRIYGLSVDHYSRMDSMYYACGFHSTINNAEGVAELGYDEESELRAITAAIQKFEELMTGPQVVMYANDTPDDMNEGRTAMLLGYMQYLRNLECAKDYTVVPLPMLDEAQYDTVGYRTVHRDRTDVWCMPTTTANKTLSGMVLEAMASSEYRLVGPFYYERFLKAHYANGADGRACFDILRDSVVYDFGRVMQSEGIGAEAYWIPCFWTDGLKYDNVFAEKYKATSGEKGDDLQNILDKFAQYRNN